MSRADHFLAVMLIALSLSLIFMKLPDVPDVRRRFYAAGAANGLALGGAVLLVWSIDGRRIGDFGLLDWWGNPAATIPAALGWSMLLLLALWLVKKGWLREPLRRIHLKYEKLMPRTRQELRESWVTSIAAGSGEEIVYRGFLLWYGAAFLGAPAALIASSLLFGLAHGYQSRFGMIFATSAGLFLGALYLASGSLLLAMWVHSTYNMSSFAAGRITLSGGSASRVDPPADEVSDGADGRDARRPKPDEPG